MCVKTKKRERDSIEKLKNQEVERQIFKYESTTISEIESMSH